MANKYEVHVIPVDDFREHEANKECWCKPSIEDGYTVRHNPSDGRNLLEEILLHEQEIPSHIGRVAALCFEGVGEADSNEEHALKWIGLRVERCKSLNDTYPSRTAFSQYVENILGALYGKGKETSP